MRPTNIKRLPTSIEENQGAEQCTDCHLINWTLAPLQDAVLGTRGHGEAVKGSPKTYGPKNLPHLNTEVTQVVSMLRLKRRTALQFIMAEKVTLIDNII